MKKYLIGVDLDDTLLDDRKNISEEALSFIREAYDKGMYFIIDTGRPFQGADRYLRLFNRNLPIISTNGGAIYFFEDNLYDIKKVIPFEMDHHRLLEFYKRVRDYVDNYAITCPYKYYALKMNELPYWVVHKDSRIEFIEGDILKILNDNPIDSEFYVRNDKLDEFLKILDEYKELKYIVWYGVGNTTSVEISSITGGKGNALLYLADYLGIDRKNTFGFGDQLNDLDLIKKAYVGVAMINASQEVKDKANYITKYDFNNDGVVSFIKEYFLNK